MPDKITDLPLAEQQKIQQLWNQSLFCFGRYQILLPQKRTGGNGSITYHKTTYKAIPNYFIGLKNAIYKMKKTGKIGSEIYITDFDIEPGRSFVYVTARSENWANNYITKYGRLYCFNFNYDVANTLYVSQGEFHIPAENGKPPANLKQIEQAKIKEELAWYKEHFIDRIQLRADNEVPKGSGVCVKGGFFADDGSVYFKGSYSLAFSDYKDTFLEFSVGDKLNPKDQPLLERVQVSSGSILSNIYTKFKKKDLRKGAREVAGMAGSEILISMKENEYLFIWESDDRSTNITFDSGTSEDNADGSPLSPAEAIVAWDSILNSVKLRE